MTGAIAIPVIVAGETVTQDVELRMPVGTVIRDLDDGALVADLARDGETAAGRFAAIATRARSSHSLRFRHFSPVAHASACCAELQFAVRLDVIMHCLFHP